MWCTLVRRDPPLESTMKPDTSIDFLLPHSSVFDSIRTSIEAYKARCSPAELAAAEATFNMLKLLHARAIEADVGLRVDENGERWVRPTKQAQHEASVNGAIYAALLLGATILDGPTILRLQREERESRPAAAREARSNFRAIVDQIIETHAGPLIERRLKPKPSAIANSIRERVLADVKAAHELGRYPRPSITASAIYKKVQNLIRVTTRQSSKEISDD